MTIALPFGTSPGRLIKVANELYRIERIRQIDFAGGSEALDITFMY